MHVKVITTGTDFELDLPASEVAELESWLDDDQGPSTLLVDDGEPPQVRLVRAHVVALELGGPDKPLAGFRLPEERGPSEECSHEYPTEMGILEKRCRWCYQAKP